ncbi:Retrovirus-related Pol polyprotein from transposon 17.6, partial [Mucuna pruriens]
MEDETSVKGSTLIMGRPFLMIAKTKIDVHIGTLSIEFGDTLLQFNIFEAVKHPTEDHSLLGIDLIDELVEEYLQLDRSSKYSENFAGSTDLISCLGSITKEADYEEVHNLPNSKDNNNYSADLEFEAELFEVLDQACNLENPECENRVETEEQEDMLLNILRQHKKAIGWKLLDLPGINPSICMHKILVEEEFKPIRLNLTILDVVKKEVTKLLVVWIIYPILDSQWMSLEQVVPKNYHKKPATRKDHFSLPFIDQVLEKSHYCFLDGFSGYMHIHIAPKDQHKTTFTCPFGTFANSRMPFGLCNAPSTFQHCMTSIFLDLLQDCMEVFMDDFTVYADSFDACLENLSKVLRRCIDTNLVINFEKCHFMVTKGIVLGHVVSNRGIGVDKSKIDIISSLPNPASVREVRSFLGHAGFYRRFIKNFMHVIAYASRTMDPAQQNYRTTEKELLAIVFALDKFRSYLLSSRIVVFFDHVALRYLLKKLDAKPRLIQWMLLLQEFNIVIRDKKGVENSIADHLSRIERESEPMLI